MSENFETGLNELYTRAAAAHSGSTGFPTTAMVATARRNRRVRAATVAMATVAAVVGVGFGGAAAVRNLGGHGDGVAPPAGTQSATPTTTGGDYTDFSCGRVIDDLEPASDRVRLEAELDATSIVPGAPLSTVVTLTAVDPSDTIDGDAALGVAYAVVSDGVVVGTATATADPGSVQRVAEGQGVSATTTITLYACPDTAGTSTTGALPAGTYDLYGLATLAFDAAQGPPFLALGGPWPFTITDAAPDPATATPDPTTTTSPVDPPQGNAPHEVSATFTEGAPLADGDYIGRLIGVDQAAGTVSVDLMVWYYGQAADDYVAANVPGGEVNDDYWIVNDVESTTTLPIAGDAPVLEWCFGGEQYFERTVAEWAAAPTSSGLDVPPTQCSDGANLLRGTLYWLDVRDGVVVAVTGQYTP